MKKDNTNLSAGIAWGLLITALFLFCIGIYHGIYEVGYGKGYEKCRVDLEEINCEYTITNLDREIYCTTVEHDRLLTTRNHTCGIAEEYSGDLIKIKGGWINKYWLYKYEGMSVEELQKYYQVKLIYYQEVKWTQQKKNLINIKEKQRNY